MVAFYNALSDSFSDDCRCCFADIFFAVSAIVVSRMILQKFQSIKYEK